MTIRAMALAAIILALASSELLLTAGSPREAGHAATAPGRSKRQAPPQPRVKYIADHADRLSGRARRSHQGAGFEDFFGASPEDPLLTYAETLCEESDGEGTFSPVNCSDADELQIWADDHPVWHPLPMPPPSFAPPGGGTAFIPRGISGPSQKDGQGCPW